MKLFLGGTVAKNNWRDQFTDDLIRVGVSPENIYNPVVPEGMWNETIAAREKEAKKDGLLLFYLADTKNIEEPISAYSIFEAAKALYGGQFARTVVIFDTEGMTGHPLKVMKQIEKDLREDFPAQIMTKGEALGYLAMKMRSTGGTTTMKSSGN